jgi:chaperone BCS1
VFYPEKDDVVKRLDFFSQNKEWYKKRGIPYTMGFLFYGAPGCGKTSTIKAIANHTQRHIVSVPLNKIKTAKELLNVFYNVRMNYKDIPLNQRLYVLEDIDAADLKDVVGERGKSEEKKEGGEEGDKEKEDSDSGVDMNLLQLLKSSATMGPLDKWKTNKLTLATLLEVLDGVMEMDGRMLIITTNYPERLDKALIRPGRIDMKVKFGLCTADNIMQMYKHYFETELPTSFDRSRLQDDVYSPAEVTQVFLNNMHKPEEGLEQLASQTATNIRLEGDKCPFSSAPSSPSKLQTKEE